MAEDLMVRHHLSSSSFWNAARPSGVCCARGATVRPRSENRFWIAGSANASTVAALSLAMISFGVPFGAQKPNQPDIRSPGTPDSSEVGMSAIDAELCGDRLASALFLPPPFCGNATAHFI